MEKEVFRTSFMRRWGMTILLLVVAILTVFHPEGTWWMTLLFIAVAVLNYYIRDKAMIIIEGKKIKVQAIGYKEDVSLNRIKKITMNDGIKHVKESQAKHDGAVHKALINNQTMVRQEDKYTEKEIKKRIFLFNENNQIVLSFLSNAIQKKDRQRFVQAIHQANPNIKIY